MSGADVFEPRLAAFVERMRENLSRPKNVAKADWRRLPISELILKLRAEVDELEEAYRQGDLKAITDEAADVANVAMMVGDLAETMTTWNPRSGL